VHSKPEHDIDDQETPIESHRSLERHNSRQKHTRTSSTSSSPSACPTSSKESSDDCPSPPLLTLEYYNFLIKRWKDRSKDEELGSLDSSTSSSENSAQQSPTIVSAMPILDSPVVSGTHTAPQVAVCTKEPLKPIYDPDFELKKISKQLLRCQKYALTSSVISINVVLIFCSWYLIPFT